MKKTFIAITAGALMSVAGWASAAEPVQLTETQMDSVSAGGKRSFAFAGGYANAGGPNAVAISDSVASAGKYWAYASNTSIAIGTNATAKSFAVAAVRR